ncbi:hypothetical protein AMQ83_27305 [Paenibacillus riograndensis]|nr:hypothetical protein AMQ83_27305 [Paenibacillus riograndensis]
MPDGFIFIRFLQVSKSITEKKKEIEDTVIAKESTDKMRSGSRLSESGKKSYRFFDEGHYYSKETLLHIPYLYIYTGRPDRAADRVRECLETYFHVVRDGLGDNEDMGCQSAFFICSSMGLYPWEINRLS